MTIQVYNVLTRQKEDFRPINPDLVTMYVCGPTVYDVPHIGHAKTYVSFDVIARYLRFSGYRLRYVQNITDVGHILDTGEDRILKGARRERISRWKSSSVIRAPTSRRWMRWGSSGPIFRRVLRRTCLSRSR